MLDPKGILNPGKVL